MAAPAVLYAAKSTADEHGSIPTQLADTRAGAGAEGRQVIAEYYDEASSAFKGNRGSGLSAAKDAAIAAGAELWVQHSDRLARGDGITADHLAEIWFALRRHGVRLRSVQDDSNLEDAIRVVLIGERNHEDSKRKSAAVRSGLKRRAERGLAVGAVPYGYRVEAMVGRDQKISTQRVLERRSAGIVNRIFDLVEAGHTFGDVARALNAEALRAPRGGQWSTRGVRKIVLNEDYTGSTGYPAIIDADRRDRIVETVKRLDPAAVQARKGGRRADGAYLLRGIAFCVKCGSPLYTRRYASGRHYLCAAVREARGTCNARKIPAELVEHAVVDHLHGFLGDVEAWIATRADEAKGACAHFAEAVAAQRTELRRLQVRAQRAHETYAKLLDQGDELAHEALRAAARMDEDALGLETSVSEAEARLEDWPTEPEVDAALDFYTELRDVIAGKLDASRSVEDTNAALRTVLEGVHLWASEDDAIVGQFVARTTGDLPALHVLVARSGESVLLRDVDERALREAGRAEPQTLVNGPVRLGVEIPPMEVRT